MNTAFKKGLNQLCARLCVGALIATAALPSLAQGKYFRYINKDGVKVIASAVPPEYVDKGYEVLGPTGQVIKVVAPAPSPEDLARVEQERALLAEYEILARRYSSSDDILKARDRRLAHLEANISILRGNISNLNAQIDDLMGKAADFEREGREVPAHIFSSIDEIRLEVASTEDVLQSRLREREDIRQEFAGHVELYEQGRALLERKQTADAGQ